VVVAASLAAQLSRPSLVVLRNGPARATAGVPGPDGIGQTVTSQDGER
jgi:hypothetical protein